MNLKRGIRNALRYAVLGFAISAVTLGMLAIYHFVFRDIHPMDREQDFARLPTLIVIVSLGLAALFALSAFGSFTPNRGLSFMHSLIIVSGATMVSVLVTRPQFPRKSINPNAWQETAIPIATAMIATIFVLSYDKWRPLEVVVDEELTKVRSEPLEP